MEIQIDKDLLRIAKEFKKKKSTLYIVGGYIRNSFLDIANTDLDVCGAMKYTKVIELVEKLGYKATVINSKLGTVLIKTSENEFEYTTFRKENYRKGGYHSPEEVSFVKDIQLDASRRDFTANALYYDIITKEVLDFYGGIKDIKNKVLKCIKTPKEVFSSDGLRILRLVRIANELGFSIDKETMKYAKASVFQLSDISKERILKEVKKIVVSDFRYNRLGNENFIENFNKLSLYRFMFGDKFKKLKIKSNNLYKQFIAIARPYRYTGFSCLLLANYFNFKYTNKAQIFWTVNTYWGIDGIRDSSKSIENIICAYNLLQQIAFKQNKIHPRETLLEYHNSKKEIKKFTEQLLYDKVRNMEEEIESLKQKNIPLSFEELNLSNIELIEEAKVTKTLVSKIRHDLLTLCLQEKLENSKPELILKAKELNIHYTNIYK